LRIPNILDRLPRGKTGFISITAFYTCSSCPVVYSYVVGDCEFFACSALYSQKQILRQKTSSQEPSHSRMRSECSTQRQTRQKSRLSATRMNQQVEVSILLNTPV